MRLAGTEEHVAKPLDMAPFDPRVRIFQLVPPLQFLFQVKCSLFELEFSLGNETDKVWPLDAFYARHAGLT